MPSFYAFDVSLYTNAFGNDLSHPPPDNTDKPQCNCGSTSSLIIDMERYSFKQFHNCFVRTFLLNSQEDISTKNELVGLQALKGLKGCAGEKGPFLLLFARSFRFSLSHQSEVLISTKSHTIKREDASMKGKSSTFVSVIIPAHNAEKHILKCVRSLSDQRTDLEYEILLVDDASSNGTGELLWKLNKSFRKVRVLRMKKRMGSYTCRNIGAKLAQGKILAFTDADCVASRDWLQKLVSPIIYNNVSAVQGANNIPQKLGLWVEFETVRLSIYGVGIDTKNFAIKRNIFKKLGGFDEQLLSGGDYDFYCRLKDAGILLHFQKNAIVYHYWPNNPLKLLCKNQLYALGDFRNFQKYGEVAGLIKRSSKVSWFWFIRRVARLLGASLRAALRSGLPLPKKTLYFFYHFLFYVHRLLLFLCYTKR